MKKYKFYTELAYVLGTLALAFGTALMQKGDFGLSMVVAPAYILHLKLSQTLPFFSFGAAEYCLQAVLFLALLLILRKGKLTYLLSFVQVLFYGLALDASIWLLSPVTADTLWVRLPLYAMGILFCSVGVSFMFRTYIPPAIYELFVKEVAGHFHIPLHKFKTGYDCVSCLAAIVLSFVCFGFGEFEGVKLGTILYAVVNGTLVHGCGKFFDKYWDFTDALALRDRF